MSDDQTANDGGKSMARRVAQSAAGTGTPGHGGTGDEDLTATPGRVSAGRTGGDGSIGGSAIGDEGVGNSDRGLAGGLSGTGGAGGAPNAADPSSGGVSDQSVSGSVLNPRRDRSTS
jgi:hypothetical protein